MGLSIRNRQRSRRIDLAYLRKITRALLDELLPDGEYGLAIHVVATEEIVRLNESYLHHEGPTDVITFDYSTEDLKLEDSLKLEACSLELPRLALHGEIFVCVDVAITQSRRFRTTWHSEVVRYIIHGVLHLRGFDDRHAAARRAMKREESRQLRSLARRFDFAQL
jgi:probable rRNA maturation factor